jgi:3-oxoacyl-[acyl-carrier protein] reductase
MTERDLVCAITGGSSGIGLATACFFARHGWGVACCGRQPQRVESARGEVAAAAGNAARVLSVTCDLRAPDDCRNFVHAAHQKFGRVDVLINNAGVAPLVPLADATDEMFNELAETNQRAVFATTQAVWPILRSQGGGTIVNVSSMAAVSPFSGFSLYGASKAWVELFSKATADEGRGLGIRAFALRLGAVDTPLLRGLFPEFPAAEMLTAGDVAEFIYLLSTQSTMRYASGSAITFAR